MNLVYGGRKECEAGKCDQSMTVHQKHARGVEVLQVQFLYVVLVKV